MNFTRAFIRYGWIISAILLCILSFSGYVHGWEPVSKIADMVLGLFVAVGFVADAIMQWQGRPDTTPVKKKPASKG